jgi:hypothetical protein
MPESGTDFFNTHRPKRSLNLRRMKIHSGKLVELPVSCCGCHWDSDDGYAERLRENKISLFTTTCLLLGLWCGFLTARVGAKDN